MAWDWLSDLFGGGGSGVASSFDTSIPNLNLSTPTLGASLGGPSAFDTSGLSFGVPSSFDVPSAMSTVPDVSGGGGFVNFLNSFGSGMQSMGDIFKALGPLANLGLAGVGIARGIDAMGDARQQQRVSREAQSQQMAMAAPAVQLAQTVLPAATTGLMGGALPPGLEAQVNDWRNTARTRIRDYFAKAGIDDSTMLAQYESWIDEQAMIMRQQLAQQLATTGMAGITVANAPIGQAGTSAAQNVASANAAVSSGMEALANLLSQDDPTKRGRR